MAKQRIGLNPKQFAIHVNNSVESLFISGLGAGKSFLLGLEAAALSRKGFKYGIRGTVGFLGAPTFDTLKNATLPQVIEAWDKISLKEDIHYVINKRPPVEWGVRPYTKLSSNRIITFRWGSYLLADSLENYNKVRSIEFDYILVDELRDVNPKAFDVLRGRIRGKAFRNLSEKLYANELKALEVDLIAGIIKEDEYLQKAQSMIGYRFLSVTTPPENPVFLEELMKRPNIFVVRGTSRDNEKNLPKGYIEGLEAVYDDLTKAREIGGEIVYDVRNKFLRSFDKDRHISERAEYRKGWGIWLSFDFNLEPFTCVIWQQGLMMQGNDKVPFIHYIDEVYLMEDQQDADKTRIESMCELIMERYRGEFFEITGDPTSKKGEMTAKPNTDAFTEILKFLECDESQLTLRHVNSNKKARILMNSVWARHPDILIHPRCKETIKDFQLVGVDALGEIEKTKDSYRSHLLDCAKYSLWTFHRDFIEVERK